MKPPFKFVGSKSSKSLIYAVNVINQHLKTRTRLVEPFSGSGAVTFAVEPKKALWNDRQVRLINFYNEVRNNHKLVQEIYEAYAEQYIEAQGSKEMFRSFRSAEPPNSTHNAAWFLFIIKACFNGLMRVSKKDKINTPHGDYVGLKRIKAALDLKEYSVFLERHNVELVCRDGLELLASPHIVESDLVYIDPPYYGSFSSYTAEGFSKDDHMKLRDVIRRCSNRGVKIIVHVGADEFMQGLYGGFCDETTIGVKRRVGGDNKRKDAYESIFVTR